MPIYEYQCRFCQHAEDVLQKVTDAPVKKCPECGKNGLQKLVSSPSFQLKGTGWYETDFKGQPKATETKSAETPAAATPAAPPPAVKTSDKSE